MFVSVPIYQCRLRRSGTLRVAEPKCGSPGDARRIFQKLLEDVPHEQVWAAFLDGGLGVVGLTQVSQGGIAGASVSPREIVQPALLSNCRSLVVAHNHPSGDATPSAQDLSMTRALQAACEVVGLELLDHIIVTRGGSYSMSEHGQMPQPH